MTVTKFSSDSLKVAMKEVQISQALARIAGQGSIVRARRMLMNVFKCSYTYSSSRVSSRSFRISQK